MATAIASNRASNASIGRKTSLPVRAATQAHRSNRNVQLDRALTGCPVMHFHSGPPMHLLSGVDTANFEQSRITLIASARCLLAAGFRPRNLLLADNGENDRPPRGFPESGDLRPYSRALRRLGRHRVGPRAVPMLAGELVA